MKQLHLHLFGHFSVIVDEVVVTEFEALSARALLAYLAVEQTHPHARTALATLLWGPDAGTNGLTNLRSGLRRVRSALGDDEATMPRLHATPDTLHLPAQDNLWVDLYQFEALLADVAAHPHRRVHHCPWCIEQLTEAVALYRGPFLENLTLASVPFEEWRQLNQERYQRMAIHALALLTDYHYRRGAWGEAEHYARRQLALEAWNEEAHQQLMQILAASGQYSAALAQYHRCRTIVAAEFDLPPMPATQWLYEEIRQARATMTNISGGTDRSFTLPKHNLSQPANALVDRKTELNWLLRRLVNPAYRLLTVVGAGGVGKTRLVLAAAWALAGCFTDGVWFVSLADVRSTSDTRQLQREMVAAVVAALGPLLDQRLASHTSLPELLANKELLLIIDNVEHLLAGREWIQTLLRVAPQVTLLITSRQPLDFQAEHLLRLSGLAVPAQPDDPAAASYDAVVLFAARARQCYPQFRLSAENLPAVVRICQIVHGLPLGIELAAALVRQLSPAELASGLTDHMEWLQSTQEDIPLRHRSMQAVFAQSWSLLSSAEQQTLVWLTVFRSGFDRQAALALLPVNGTLLAPLVDKSLLQQDSAERYELHDLLRRFLMAHAQETALATAAAQHSAYYLDFLRQHEQSLRGQAVESALALARLEIDNIRAAWTWGIAHGSYTPLVAAADALALVCKLLGLWQAGAQLLHATALALGAQGQSAIVPGSAAQLTTVLTALTKLYVTSGDAAQLASVAQQLITLGRRSSHLPARAAGHWAWGKTLIAQSHLKRARRHLTVAQQLAQQAAWPSLQADTLFGLGEVAYFLGENQPAQVSIQQALTMYRQLDQRQEEADALRTLSHLYQSDPAKVYTFTMHRLRLAQRAGSLIDEFHALHRLVILWLNVGDYAQVREGCLQALRLAERLKSPYYSELFLDFLALAYHYLGDDLTALRYLGQMIRLCTDADNQRSLAYALHWSGQVYLALGELTNAATCYRDAAAIRHRYHQPQLVLQSQAALAVVQLTQGEARAAWDLVAPIVEQLSTLRQQSLEDPVMLWFNCYQVLQAHTDPRAAQVLEHAHGLIQTRAACITDAAMRHTFLQNIAIHRQILLAWQARLNMTLDQTVATEQHELPQPAYLLS